MWRWRGAGAGQHLPGPYSWPAAPLGFCKATGSCNCQLSSGGQGAEPAGNPPLRESTPRCLRDGQAGLPPARIPPPPPPAPGSGPRVLTSGGQAGAAASVLAGPALTGVGIEHAAQLQLGQAHHLGEAAALVLQRQLVVIQHHRVQAALEAAQHLRDPRVGQAADAVRLHQGPEVDGALGAQCLEVEGRPAALHVAVVQGQAGEVAVELQEDGVPAPVVDRAARDAQDAGAAAAVQLKPQPAIHDLRGTNTRVLFNVHLAMRSWATRSQPAWAFDPLTNLLWVDF